MNTLRGEIRISPCSNTFGLDVQKICASRDNFQRYLKFWAAAIMLTALSAKEVCRVNG